MIVILFTAGNFGSTIEYCLREFSNELKKVQFGLLEDGSMHGYGKSFHPVTFDQWNNHPSGIDIATPVFPNKNYQSPIDSLMFYQTQIKKEDSVIFIDSNSLDQAQRTQLFNYHKNKNNGLLDVLMLDKAQSWNPEYTHWQDMQIFELREALSFYADQQHQHVNLKNHVPSDWLIVDPDKIIWNLPKEITRMMPHCGLTINDEDLEEFYQKWLDKQKYILDEFDLIIKILNYLDTDQFLSWPGLSLFGEAILQSRLRQNGHELDMVDLNQFPNNTVDLRGKLIRA